MEQTSDRLASDERSYRLLVQAIVDYAIFMIAPDGTIATWNAGAERIKGYKPEEIIGKPYTTFFTDEDRARGLPNELLETARQNGRAESEGWRVRKDGSRFWALAVIDTIRDETGKVVGFAKVTRDMTERRAAQEALIESERRFRLLVQGVTDYAIFMLDPEGRITNWNSGAERAKGYKAEEIIGEHFSRFYTEEDLQRGIPKLALETAAREGRFEAEGWRVRKDGQRFWANVVIDAIRDEAGTLIGFAKVTRDLTERRKAQRNLEAAREQLIQSQKMEAIGQLTGGVAHDFNNLLNVIVGGADILSRLIGDNERARRILANMQYAAERGASLTGHLLAFARRQALVPRMIETQELLEGTSGLLSRSLQGNVTLEVDVPNDIWPTVADQNQLELAILNVGLNARDAMPSGGRLRIAARNEVRHDGDYVAIAIRDTGEGIPEDIRDKVLEPFFTTKGVGKGSGLGLSQAYGFAIQSGGSLSIDSAVGKGTTVTFHLPAAKAASAHGEKEDPAGVAVKGSGTILMVEDDPAVADFVSDLLEDAGFTVTVVHDTRTAFDRLQAGEQFDLVFSDIIMPGGMNGVELAYRVRAVRPAQLILLSTGYINTGVGQEASTFPLIRKPYRAAELTGVI